jgi:hypothetical protein
LRALAGTDDDPGTFRRADESPDLGADVLADGHADDADVVFPQADRRPDVPPFAPADVYPQADIRPDLPSFAPADVYPQADIRPDLPSFGHADVYPQADV